MYWNDAAWWAWIPMTLTMIVFWGLIAWVVFRALVTTAPDDPPSGPTARGILDARLARGEIAPDEYAELREVLEAEHGGAEAERIGRAR